MNQPNGRCCPVCKSTEYLFRHRKKIPAENDEPEHWETKRKCKACGKEWKEKEAACAGRTARLDKGGACGPN